MDAARCCAVPASADHAALGVALGIVQEGQGKAAPVRQMQPGDGVVIYAPGRSVAGGPAAQVFTAIGRVAKGAPWQAAMTDTITVWCRAMLWHRAVEAPIRPLLEAFDLTPYQPGWGMAFRCGLRSLTRADFACSARDAGGANDGVTHFNSGMRPPYQPQSGKVRPCP